MHDYDNTITELAKHDPHVSIDPAADRIEELELRVADLSIALRDLIVRVESIGGYASPEEQDVLRRAKTVLAGKGR